MMDGNKFLSGTKSIFTNIVPFSTTSSREIPIWPVEYLTQALEILERLGTPMEPDKVAAEITDL